MTKKKAMKRKHTTISIPKPLYERIKKRLRNTGFSSVSSYVTYVLREIEANISRKGKENRERIEEKLRALGYL
ncbi:CopG family transcriptional regulator [Nanoarchaeota archaeon]|nr:MAG: CopG family transcriptional regulator [Nanoarchaeota archaeon]